MILINLGDYVDRGLQGIEVMALLLAIKVKYPSKVFLLRGNHEDGNTCMSYGFYEECQEKFVGEGDAEKVFRKFLDVFAWLPAAAVIDQTILCMHGGISPHLRSLDDIRKIERPRPIPPFGLMTDLVWSDPSDERDGWSMNPRGISYTFSTAEVESACRRLGVELIVRAHQMTNQMYRNGYSFFAGGRLLTIFSAPNYLNMGNDGCLLRISRENERGTCTPDSNYVSLPLLRRRLCEHSGVGRARCWRTRGLLPLRMRLLQQLVPFGTDAPRAYPGMQTSGVQ
ncbi:Ser/Thr protein phosphatase family protein, partial [Aphelenchoides avenae]